MLTGGEHKAHSETTDVKEIHHISHCPLCSIHLWTPTHLEPIPAHCGLTLFSITKSAPGKTYLRSTADFRLRTAFYQNELHYMLAAWPFPIIDKRSNQTAQLPRHFDWNGNRWCTWPIIAIAMGGRVEWREGTDNHQSAYCIPLREACQMW